jgi:hypothetical protein
MRSSRNISWESLPPWIWGRMGWTVSLGNYLQASRWDRSDPRNGSGYTPLTLQGRSIT